MFFIGVFGIDNKSKVISTRQNIVCPICQAYGRYDIVKTYSYFHFFFIPLWQWNKQYFIQTGCCKKLCPIDTHIGIRIENGENIDIKSEHIHCNQGYNPYECLYCQGEINPSFRFCPHCGRQI